MRCLAILVAIVLFFPACSGNQIAEKNAKSEAKKSSDFENTQSEKDAESDAAELFESMQLTYEKKKVEWRERGTKEMSPTEQQDHYKSHPAEGYGEELVEFAEKHPESNAAKQAWSFALKYAMGKHKQRAAEEVLKSAMADFNSSSAMERFEYLMKYAAGDSQKKAMELMLAQAEKETDSKVSLEIIKKVATSQRGAMISDGVILMPGNAEVREQALSQLWDLAMSEIQSDRAISCFELLFRNGKEKIRKDSFEQLLKHHSTHEQTMAIVSSLGQSVTAENKAMIEQAIACPDKNASANAIVALSKFHNRKEREFLHYETAPPMDLMGLGEKRAAYLKSKIDPAEIEKVEKQLVKFVEGASEDTDIKVLANAKKQLFEIQNLGIGKRAPEIAGQDFDGADFKLSDYRGQVVLLNFWGDW